jgi:hypothetical protein
MPPDVFIFRSASKSVLQKLRSIAGVLLAVGLPFGIASCKPTENTSASDTEQTSAGNTEEAKVVKDFGPTLLRIGEGWELDGNWIAPAGKYGFIDTDGHVVIKPQWDAVTRYDHGFENAAAVVRQNGKWGLIEYKRDSSAMSATENLFGKKTIIAAWFDSTGKQISSSTDANTSESGRGSPSPRGH